MQYLNFFFVKLQFSNNFIFPVFATRKTRANIEGPLGNMTLFQNCFCQTERKGKKC